MKKVLPKAWRARFDAAAEISPKSGVMFWHARDVMDLLAYSPRAVLKPVVDRAIAACDEAGRDAEAHFLAVTRTVADKGAKTKEVADFRLTRFGALMLAQITDDREEATYARQYFSEPAPAPKPVSPVAKPAAKPVAKKAAAVAEKTPAAKPAKKAAAGKPSKKAEAPVASAKPVKGAKTSKAATPAKGAKAASTSAKNAAGKSAEAKKAAKPVKAKAAKKAAVVETKPNSWQAALTRKQSETGATAGGAFIPGKQAERVNPTLNPRLNQNLAYGRGYPNSAARNAR